MDRVSTEIRDHVAHVTLTRGDKMNGVDYEMAEAIVETGEAWPAAEALQALGIKIYTIGVGGTEPAPFAVKTPFGTKIIRQRVDLDEETLMKVAEIGRGQYFRAAETDRLEEIYDIIDQQEKTEVKVKEFFHFKELYFWFLVPAIILLLVEIAIRTTVLRTIP